MQQRTGIIVLPHLDLTIATSLSTRSSAIAETELQGGLVLAESGRPGLGQDILQTL